MNHILVKAVVRREPAIDFKTATSANLTGMSDNEVLNIAASENRILVSHDQRTMPKHFSAFTAERKSSGVIIVSKKMPVAEAVEDLIMIWAICEPDEWINRIANLPL